MKTLSAFKVCLLLSLVAFSAGMIPAYCDMSKEDLELIIKQQAQQIEDLKAKLKAKTGETSEQPAEEDRQAFLQKQWQLEQEYRQRGLERAHQAEMLEEAKKLRRSVNLLRY